MDSNQQIILELDLISSNEQIKQKRKFELIKIIGNGTEGQVYLARPKGQYYNVETVALKRQKQIIQQIWDFYIKLIEQQQEKEKEKNGLQNKSNIIRIYEICKDDENFYIIMEVGEQDLYNYLKYNQQIELQNKFQICQNLAQSILELHSINYIHRDIKPENFIRIGEQFKLVDFGLTKSMSQFQNTLGVGSRIFQAPELLQGDGTYSSSVDIWALGCTFYEVLTLKSLIEANTLLDAQQIILKHTNDKNYIYNRIDQLAVPSQWKDLLKDMFKPKSEERISAIKLVETINQLINPEPYDKKINHFFFAKHLADIADIAENNSQPNQFIINPKNFSQFSNIRKVPQNNKLPAPVNNIVNVQTTQRIQTFVQSPNFNIKGDLKQSQESSKQFPYQEQQQNGNFKTKPHFQSQNPQFQQQQNPQFQQQQNPQFQQQQNTQFQYQQNTQFQQQQIPQNFHHIGSNCFQMQQNLNKVQQLETENSKFKQTITDLDSKLTQQTEDMEKLKEDMEKLKEGMEKLKQENTQLRNQKESIIDQFNKCNDQFQSSWQIINTLK